MSSLPTASLSHKVSRSLPRFRAPYTTLGFAAPLHHPHLCEIPDKSGKLSTRVLVTGIQFFNGIQHVEDVWKLSQNLSILSFRMLLLETGENKPFSNSWCLLFCFWTMNDSSLQGCQHSGLFGTTWCLFRELQTKFFQSQVLLSYHNLLSTLATKNKWINSANFS